MQQTTEGHNYLNNEDDFLTINKDRVITKLISKNNVLEIGCGKGTFLLELAKRGISCEGIDFSKDAFQSAKERCSGQPITLHYGDFTTYTFHKKYDCIILSAILEHIEDDKAFLKKVNNVLAKDGELILLTSAHPWLYSVFDKTVHHYRRYSKKQLHSLLKETGFTPVSSRYWDILGMPFLLIARVSGKMPLNDKQLTNKYLNRILDYWFQIFENKISLPLGLNVIIVARK
jgi:ubiquinone/menaquinone biosynthesis C-methylase UbiE